MESSVAPLGPLALQWSGGPERDGWKPATAGRFSS